MFNTDKIQPTGTVLPKVMRVGISFGEPMFFEGDSSDLQYLREVTDQIMKRIQQLSGQEYVDTYAVKAKKSGKSDDETEEND
jgi:1-acyl-sn-glycerol-3-phosphate acyltransferase